MFDKIWPIYLVDCAMANWHVTDILSPVTIAAASHMLQWWPIELLQVSGVAHEWWWRVVEARVQTCRCLPALGFHVEFFCRCVNNGVLLVVQAWCRGNPLFYWSVNEAPSMVVELATCCNQNYDKTTNQKRKRVLKKDLGVATIVILENNGKP